MKLPRVPAEPLIEVALKRWRPTNNDFRYAPNLSSQGKTAQVLDVDRQTVRRWQLNGLDVHRADREAHKLGYMPQEIWECWYALPQTCEPESGL